MIFKDKQQSIDSLVALQMAALQINSADLANRISKLKSRDNIGNNVGFITIADIRPEDVYISIEAADLSITEKIGFKPIANGNGLFVTDDYFLTTNHAKQYLEENSRDVRRGIRKRVEYARSLPYPFFKYHVRNQGGQTFATDPTFSVSDADNDLALVRVVYSGKPQPNSFRVLHRDIKTGDNLRLMSFRDGSYHQKFGQVLAPSSSYSPGNGKLHHDIFETDIAGTFGESGGPFVTNNGELAGILSGGNASKSLSFGVKTKHIKSFLAKAVYDLAQKVMENRIHDIYIPNLRQAQFQ